MKLSIIMTTFNRPNQLRFCLESIHRQRMDRFDHEVLVIDDGHENESWKVSKYGNFPGMNIRHIHTGCRTNKRWRTMGFSANIGIQQAQGEIVALTSSDCYHFGDTVGLVYEASLKDRAAISSVNKVFDDNGSLIESLIAGNADAAKKASDEIRNSPHQPGFYPANPDMPFFLATRREHLINLGGYDEDFIGIASEDCDLLDRLQDAGCHYVYAPEGADIIHLYHGRKSIKELEDNPGFRYNIRLRNERQGILVRNKNRKWGELINPHAPKKDAPIHLVLWTTSKCNMSCVYCNQDNTRKQFPGYSMDQEELSHLISSCKAREIHFSTVELSGGEPTLWPLFDTAIDQLQKSGITDAVTFITNGQDAKHVAEIANKYGLYYVVSQNHCSEENYKIHKQLGVGLVLNTGKHLPLPKAPVKGSIPGTCTQQQDMHGRVICQLMYINGNVWYCCSACANVNKVRNKHTLSQPFESDFPAFFSIRKFTMNICSVCLCNKIIWDRLSLE